MDERTRRQRYGGAAPVALVVGDRGTLPRALIDAAAGGSVLLARFEQIDAALLGRHRPALVLSRAVSRGFDALDLAHRLTALRFRGHLVALADALPCPELVRAEVALACPALPFEVIVTGKAARWPSGRLLRAI